MTTQNTSSTSTSTSSTSTTPATTSSTNTVTYDALLKQLQNNAKPKTPAQIKAEGDVKIKVGILWFVGATSIALIAIGAIPLIKNPETAKDVWVIIGPILSSVLTATVAYFSGEKHGSQK